MKINRNKIPNKIGTNVDIEDNSLVYNRAKIGNNTRILFFANIYGCEIGENCMIGSFVEIQSDVKIGDKCKIQSHAFICSGVTIGNETFVGHGVMFINDKNPRTTNANGELEKAADWKDRYVETKIGNNVSIGSNATIMGGITIGDGALIGAGSVVTKDVPAGETWVGVPARKLEK